MSHNSYRTILRSSSIIGGAQVVNIAVGLVKMKVVAVLLGPAGVGLAGLYGNLIQTASAVSAMGIGNVGTRQIAAAQAEGGAEAEGRSRRALFWGTLILSAIGALLFWLASGYIARVILHDPSRTNDVAWLSVGVALTVAASAQSALLTGLRRVGDLARMNIGVALLGSALGVLSLWIWGQKGLLAMVLIAPTASFVLGHIYVARLPAPAGPPATLQALLPEWRAMLGLGFIFMVSSFVGTAGQLLVRSIIQRELGSEPLGQFQASWMIGATYLGFVLGAMGTDYYPRLTAVIANREAATRLVNEQTEVALLLSAPVLLLMLGFAPWILHILYSAEFRPAVDILRWQLLGDVFKVISWPLGFVLLAAGEGRKFLMAEALAMAVFAVGAWVGLPLMGIQATGASFLLMYLLYLPMAWLLVQRTIGFRWERGVKIQAGTVILAASVVDGVARWSEFLGAAIATVLAAVLAIAAARRLADRAKIDGRVSRILNGIRR